ncbi:MAG: hypothetical protein EBS38_04880 [Actinobacteria bacterium]|nr:hypothetical protein [Actinomycetota bacterium]
MAKTIFYGVMSLDGFLAGPNDDMSWAEKYLSNDQDYGWMELVQSCGAVLMGRKTFEFEMKNAPDLDRMLPTYVLTSQPLRFDGVSPENLQFISGDLKAVIPNIMAKHPGDLFIGGGAQLVEGLLQDGLLDQLELFIAPDVLGRGVRLFQDPNLTTSFEVLKTEHYQSGLVRMSMSPKASKS